MVCQLANEPEWKFTLNTFHRGSHGCQKTRVSLASLAWRVRRCRGDLERTVTSLSLLLVCRLPPPVVLLSRSHPLPREGCAKERVLLSCHHSLHNHLKQKDG